MRRISLIVGIVLTSITLYAQNPFPKSAKEDTEKVMSDAYWKIWNPKVQAKIDKNIEKHRKADAVIQLESIIKGTEVKVEQISHDFYFGASAFNFNQLGTPDQNMKYRDLFGTLFNSATVPFYWNIFEMEPNRPRFREEYWDTENFWNRQENREDLVHWRRPSPGAIVDYCISRGVRVHGHPLIWGTRGRSQHMPGWIFDYATPEERKNLERIVKCIPTKVGEWDQYTDAYKELTPEQLEEMFPNLAQEMKRLFEKRIVEIAEYYGGRIESWDVVNESARDFSEGRMIPGSKICQSWYGLMPGDYTFESFKVANRVFPKNVKLNINDYWTGNEYPEQVKDLMRRGAKIDIVGSQMHLFDPQQCLDIAAGKEIQTPNYVWELMKRLSKPGLPIHLSEITITSPGDDERGRKIQAIITQNLYRLWFSIEPMMAITWWNVVDGCGLKGEPTVSGLFTRDMQPKPAYYALDNLINHEWKTNLTLKADKNGQVKFRGFKGKYKLSWVDENGESHSIIYHLK